MRINYNKIRNFKAFAVNEKEELKKKYFDLFYSKIKVEGDLNEQEKDFLIRQLYYRGQICILKRVDERPLLCPFAVSSWNNEDFPVDIEFINKRNIEGIFPKTKGVNMVDCVIGYIRPSKYSISQYVEHQIDKIVDISVTMKVNEFVQRLPLLIGISPKEKEKFNSLINKIWNGEVALFAETDDFDKMRSMVQTTYNIDKLRAEKEALENELKTQLGINNNNNIKKERMIVDEVNANNDEIASSSDVYLRPLEAFCKNVKEVLGFDINIIWDTPLSYEINYEEEEEEDE